MFRPTDTDYYQRRVAQERLRAEQATDPIARRVHSELADRYADLLGAVDIAA